MTRLAISAIGIAWLATATLIAAQAPSGATAAVLGTVRIPHAVLADGKPLPPGTYEIRLSSDSLDPLPGQTPGIERRVEFVMNGMVVGRDVATIYQTDQPVGTSGGAPRNLRVEMLKGDEFLRISQFRDGARYLIHLPVVK